MEARAYRLSRHIPQFSLRVIFLLVTVLALLLWAIHLAYELSTTVPTVPLSDVVAQFNIDASADEAGNHEPPLSVGEVLTAISTELPALNASPSTKAIYERIVKTQQLPTTARLTSTFDSEKGPLSIVWWINLDVVTDKSTAYSLRIREANVLFDAKTLARPYP
jgi:hypothetical protein